MQPLSFTDHLAAAAAAGVDLPPFATAGGVLHYWDCSDPGYKTAVEPGHHSLSLLQVGECSNCWNDAQQTPAGIGTVIALMQLPEVARQATYLHARTVELENPNHLLELQRQGRNYDDWLEHFTTLAAELRRRGRDGSCSLAGDGPYEVHTPDEMTPLRSYTAQQATALSDQWHALTAVGTLRQHVLDHRARKTPRGAFSPRAPRTTHAVRAVPASALDHLLDPADGTIEYEAMALIAESTAIAAHGHWEAIAWDTRLDKWAPSHSVAVGEHTATELNLALAMYTGEGASMQDLLDGVRSAHLA